MSRTSGIASDMIVRGWRRRRAERDLVGDLDAARLVPGASRPAAASVGPGAARRTAARWRDGWRRAGGVGHGRIIRVGHRRVPRCPPAAGPRAGCPGARFTTLASGVRVRTIYEARPGSPATLVRAASIPSGVDGSTSTTVYATPTSMTLCASRHRDAGQPELERERGRPLVAGPADDPRVVRLDPVDELADPLQLGVLEHRPAVLVERVRDADEAALLAHLGDRLARGAAGRDGALAGTAR